MSNDTQKILRELKRTVILASKQARAGSISGDKLKTLSCLVNSYGRLLQIDGEQSDDDMLRDGQPDFYEALNQ